MSKITARRGFKPNQPTKRTTFPDVETKRPPTAVYPPLDERAARHFLYITNVSERDYQFEMSQRGVTANTLVILPTSIGKTFIGTILIFNFYRWFPTGKILFLAPTCPLIDQQYQSTKRITQIPKGDTAKLTASIDPKSRSQIWQNKRVFFATPQTVQNDLESGVCPATRIVLIVIDEAYHARGNHSYCKVISEVALLNSFFRVIALSATPGRDFEEIQQLIFNLMISQIEFRSKDQLDKYTHEKIVESIVIPDAEGVLEINARISAAIKPYMKQLCTLNVISRIDTNISKGKCQELIKNSPGPAATQILVKVMKIVALRQILQEFSIPMFSQRLKEYLKESREDDETHQELKLILATTEKMPQSDPKMEKLIEIVTDFLAATKDSKIIVFCSSRPIVAEITNRLKQANPIIKVDKFIGQKSKTEDKGQNQGIQLRILDLFRKGHLNTIVSTSVGEEGLDIADCDLIVCYDVQKTPSRTIQRMGRTGRMREGKCIFLLSESTKNFLPEAQSKQDNVEIMLKNRMKDFEFYESPKMNPYEFEIIRKHVEIKESQEKQAKIITRKTLTTVENDELIKLHGEYLQFEGFNLAAHTNNQIALIGSKNVTNSAESTILSNLIIMARECDTAAEDVAFSLFKFDSSSSDIRGKESINSSLPPSPHLSQMMFSAPSSSQPIPEVKDHSLKMVGDLLGINITDSESDSEILKIIEHKNDDRQQPKKVQDFFLNPTTNNSNILDKPVAQPKTKVVELDKKVYNVDSSIESSKKQHIPKTEAFVLSSNIISTNEVKDKKKKDDVEEYSPIRRETISKEKNLPKQIEKHAVNNDKHVTTINCEPEDIESTSSDDAIFVSDESSQETKTKVMNRQRKAPLIFTPPSSQVLGEPEGFTLAKINDEDDDYNDEEEDTDLDGFIVRSSQIADASSSFRKNAVQSESSSLESDLEPTPNESSSGSQSNKMTQEKDKTTPKITVINNYSSDTSDEVEICEPIKYKNSPVTSSESDEDSDDSIIKENDIPYSQLSKEYTKNIDELKESLCIDTGHTNKPLVNIKEKLIGNDITQNTSTQNRSNVNSGAHIMTDVERKDIKQKHSTISDIIKDLPSKGELFSREALERIAKMPQQLVQSSSSTDMDSGVSETESFISESSFTIESSSEDDEPEDTVQPLRSKKDVDISDHEEVDERIFTNRSQGFNPEKAKQFLKEKPPPPKPIKIDVAPEEVCNVKLNVLLGLKHSSATPASQQPKTQVMDPNKKIDQSQDETTDTDTLDWSDSSS